VGRGTRGSRVRWGRDWGSSDWSHPSREGLAPAANSHLVRRLCLARPGPRGGLLLLFHGCHRRWPASELTSSRALQTRGLSLGRDRMSQAPVALGIGGRKSSGSDGWGGEGNDREGKKRGSWQAPLAGPSVYYRRPSNSPLPRPPPPKNIESLGDLTQPSGKLTERRAADS
jgi:hypothetical protein